MNDVDYLSYRYEIRGDPSTDLRFRWKVWKHDQPKTAAAAKSGDALTRDDAWEQIEAQVQEWETARFHESQIEAGEITVSKDFHKAEVPDSLPEDWS